MGIVVVGLSHKTAPIELRERLSLPPNKIEEVALELKDHADTREAVVLSTCNRFEIYARPRQNRQSAIQAVRNAFQKLYPHPDIQDRIYERESVDAVRHLFRVAAGLDSMVIGETEILGQVKNAYLTSQKIGATGKITNVMFQRALFMGKNVRLQTHLSDGASSVGSIAVRLAEKIFGPLSGHKILLLGAGNMAETTARHLLSQKAGEIMVLNRTESKAKDLAQTLNGAGGPLTDLAERLVEADIVICSLTSQEPIITGEMMDGLMEKRRNKSLYLIDIAVPRNVDSRVNDVDNVYVYDIDDLQNIVEESMEKRKTAVAQAESLLTEAALQFQTWVQAVLDGKQLALRHQALEKSVKESL